MITTETNGVPSHILADVKAVLDSFAQGKPVDPEVARRVREESRKAALATRQQHGDLNVAVDLIREVRDRE